MNCHFSKIASLLAVAVSIPAGACTMAAGEPSRFRSDAFIQKLKDLESFTDSISFNQWRGYGRKRFLRMLQSNVR